MDHFKQLYPTLVLAASLIIAQGSIALFGKDNILQMIAEVVAQEIIAQQGGTCQLAMPARAPS